MEEKYINFYKKFILQTKTVNYWLEETGKTENGTDLLSFIKTVNYRVKLVIKRVK